MKIIRSHSEILHKKLNTYCHTAWLRPVNYNYCCLCFNGQVYGVFVAMNLSARKQKNVLDWEKNLILKAP